jgi:hypothetical protein
MCPEGAVNPAYSRQRAQRKGLRFNLFITHCR